MLCILKLHIIFTVYSIKNTYYNTVKTETAVYFWHSVNISTMYINIYLKKKNCCSASDQKKTLTH